MAEKPVKIAVVGCTGLVRSVHIPAIRAFPDLLKLTAICDRDPEVAEYARKLFPDVPVFLNLDDMLGNADVDLVSFRSFALSHHHLGIRAARAGKHVLMVKPITLTLPCADSLIAACRKAGTELFIAENALFMPSEQLVRFAIDKGILGETVSSELEDRVCGMATDVAIHRMAQIRRTLTSKPARVTGYLAPEKYPTDFPYDNMRNFADFNLSRWGLALIECEDGAIARCELTGFGGKGLLPLSRSQCRRVIGMKGVWADAMWPSGGRMARGRVPTLHALDGGKWKRIRVERETYRQKDGREFTRRFIIKTRPQAVWENPFVDRTFTYTEHIKDKRMPMSPDEMAEWQLSDAFTVHGAARSILDGKDPLYSGLDGRADLELIMAMHLSDERGGLPVPLPVREVTEHEKRVHAEYRKTFRHDMLDTERFFAGEKTRKD